MKLNYVFRSFHNVLFLFYFSTLTWVLLALLQTFPADQLWGVIARGVSNQSELQDVDDCMGAIRSELAKPTVRSWIGTGVAVNVLKLDATRAWRDHIPGLGVKLEGGLLRDDTGNHLFLAMLRRGWINHS